MTNSFLIKKINVPHRIGDSLSDSLWNTASVLRIENVRTESKVTPPETSCRVLYDGSGLYLRFDVKDNFVECRCLNYQDGVCEDSCVEFFVKPSSGDGYVNFEFNGSGTMLSSHVLDPARLPGGGLAKAVKLDSSVNLRVKRYTTLPVPAVVPPIDAPVDWTLRVYIPFDILEETHHISPPKSGDVWTANFYKCGTSRPHWASWNPVPVLNFHLPDCFGPVTFE